MENQTKENLDNIIQISDSCSNNGHMIIALCTDGSVWKKFNDDKYWFLINTGWDEPRLTDFSKEIYAENVKNR